MKALTLIAAAALAAAIAAPGAADAKAKKKRWTKQQHWSSQQCANGYRGVDCSTVSARDPDRRLRGQIISDFRRGVDTPGNGR